MRYTFPLILLGLLLATATAAPPAHAQMGTTLIPTAVGDRYTPSTFCQWNHPDEFSIISNTHTTFLRFDMTAIPSNAQIISATLTMTNFASSQVGPGTMNIHAASGITTSTGDCATGQTLGNSQSWYVASWPNNTAQSVDISAVVQNMVDDGHTWLRLDNGDPFRWIYNTVANPFYWPSLNIIYTAETPIATVTPIMTPIATPGSISGTIDFNYNGLPPLPEPFELSPPEHEIEMDWAWDISLITNIFRIIRTIPLVVANMPGWAITMYAVLVLLSLRLMLRVAGFVAQRRRIAEQQEEELRDEVDAILNRPLVGDEVRGYQ